MSSDVLGVSAAVNTLKRVKDNSFTYQFESHEKMTSCERFTITHWRVFLMLNADILLKALDGEDVRADILSMCDELGRYNN